jgi:hypothetical protein
MVTVGKNPSQPEKSEWHGSPYKPVVYHISNLGFPKNIFESENYLASGYLYKNFFNPIPHCQPKEFYKFLRHVTSPIEQGELQKISMQEKLEKRAFALGLTIHGMVEVQMSDLTKRNNGVDSTGSCRIRCT